jgi:predicted esterase
MLTGGRTPSQADFALVLLHGRGAGARDIMGLGEALALPDIAMAAPEAPGLSWWPTSFLAPAAQMEPFVQAGLDAIRAAIATFEAAGLPRARIGLLGFSQGGCLAAEYLAREGSGLGFGFILSGGLVGTEDKGEPLADLYGFADKALDYDTNLQNLHLYSSCHEADPHIPHKRFADSSDVLRGLGAEVTQRSKPGAGHGIDENDVAAIRRALNVAPA